MGFDFLLLIPIFADDASCRFPSKLQVQIEYMYIIELSTTCEVIKGSRGHETELKISGGASWPLLHCPDYIW